MREEAEHLQDKGSVQSESNPGLLGFLESTGVRKRGFCCCSEADYSNSIKVINDPLLETKSTHLKTFLKDSFIFILFV